jgi:hypothetical protein
MFQLITSLPPQNKIVLTTDATEHAAHPQRLSSLAFAAVIVESR